MTSWLPSAPVPRLLASTGQDYNRTKRRRDSCNSISSQSSGTSVSNSDAVDDEQHGSNFRNLLWSSDGTSLVTTGSDNTVRTFILPPDLLEPPQSEGLSTDQPNTHHLEPYSNHVHPNPIYSTALSPYYTLSSPETTLILTSPSSLPIRLFSPFASGVLATYPLVDVSTEKWIAPYSLLFSVPYSDHITSTDGVLPQSSLHFLAGSRNQISFFDVSRDGSSPITTLATAPGNRKARRGGSIAMAGIVSCMSMSCEGILAAGTFSRGIGLYDAQGVGDTIGTWSLKDSEEGAGVTNIHWSRCGRYLVAAERGSLGIGVWDIRGTGRRLAWLTGRDGLTMQRLGIALGNSWQGSLEHEYIYAGGIDGCVRVWNDIGQREGEFENDWYWKAHNDVVSGLGVHSCGSVIATCSGSRHDGEIFDDESTNKSDEETIVGRDNSIRVWVLEDRGPPDEEELRA